MLHNIIMNYIKVSQTEKLRYKLDNDIICRLLKFDYFFSDLTKNVHDCNSAKIYFNITQCKRRLVRF